MAPSVIFLLISIIVGLIFLLVFSPPPRRCHDCEALSLSESEALPPTPHEVEHARHPSA